MRKNRLKRIIIVMAMVMALGVTACGSESRQAVAGKETERSEASAANSESGGEEVPSKSGEIFAMDTYMTVTCYGERCDEALEASLNEIRRLDDLLSVGNEDSEISYVNQNGKGIVSKDTGDMLSRALETYRTTEGVFDITVYPIMELWGFTDGNFAVPAEDELAEELEKVGSDRILFDEGTNEITLGEGQGIDLGGIAKGFTSDRLMEIFEEYELVSGMVSLGGNVQCYGSKPDGSKWRCGIQDPLNADDGGSFLGILQLEDEAVITSGAYERNFTGDDGTVYHHIIDPKTGYPANSGVISATIVSRNGMLADALSTACYIMGIDGAIEYWRSFGEDFEMILMDEGEKVYITEGLESDFTSGYEVEVVER